MNYMEILLVQISEDTNRQYQVSILMVIVRGKYLIFIETKT